MGYEAVPVVNAVYSEYGEVLVINNSLVVVLLMKIVFVVSIKMWI